MGGESTQKTSIQCGQAVKQAVLGCRMKEREILKILC